MLLLWAVTDITSSELEFSPPVMPARETENGSLSSNTVISSIGLMVGNSLSFEMVTVNETVSVFPRESVATQVSVVVPNGNSPSGPNPSVLLTVTVQLSVADTSG